MLLLCLQWLLHIMTLARTGYPGRLALQGLVSTVCACANFPHSHRSSNVAWRSACDCSSSPSLVIDRNISPHFFCRIAKLKAKGVVCKRISNYMHPRKWGWICREKSLNRWPSYQGRIDPPKAGRGHATPVLPWNAKNSTSRARAMMINWPHHIRPWNRTKHHSDALTTIYL